MKSLRSVFLLFFLPLEQSELLLYQLFSPLQPRYTHTMTWLHPLSRFVIACIIISKCCSLSLPHVLHPQDSVCVCVWHFDHGSQALFISAVLKRLLIGIDPTRNIVLSAEHELPWGIRAGTFLLRPPSPTIPIHWKEITNTALSLPVRSVYLISIYLWSKQGCQVESGSARMPLNITEVFNLSTICLKLSGGVL